MAVIKQERVSKKTGKTKKSLYGITVASAFKETCLRSIETK